MRVICTWRALTHLLGAHALENYIPRFTLSGSGSSTAPLPYALTRPIFNLRTKVRHEYSSRYHWFHPGVCTGRSRSFFGASAPRPGPLGRSRETSEFDAQSSRGRGSQAAFTSRKRKASAYCERTRAFRNRERTFSPHSGTGIPTLTTNLRSRIQPDPRGHRARTAIYSGGA